MDKTKRILRNYKCPWCGCEFKQEVRMVMGKGSGKGAKPSDGKHANGSNQVKCLSCGNFLETWV